jgi:hypothetical protein
MPSYWTHKQERQYGHIKDSCVKRKCRTVRGKKQCVRTCTRMAAATTNKFRSQGLGAVHAFELKEGGFVECDGSVRVLRKQKRGARGLGSVRGKCCVLRGKKRIACFHSKKDALALKRSLKKTQGLRIACV